MRVQELMSSPVVTVGPEVPVHDAAGLLAERGFTALPVVDRDGDLIGIITEADALRGRIFADPRTAAPAPADSRPARTVGEVMTRTVVSTTATADAAEVATTMLTERLRAIPVVDAGRPVGIVTRRDLMRCIGRDDALVAADIRHRLEVYGGPGRWTVAVCDGEVTITDEHDDPVDLHVAHVLATSVAGASVVRVTSTACGG